MPAQRSELAWHLLGHGVTLGAIALLVVNDHVLKHACPSWLTGKLSDFAGLAFFPALLLAGASVALRRALGLRALAAAVLVTATVFAWVKVDPFGTATYRAGLAAVQWPYRAAVDAARGRTVRAPQPVHAVTDPTDLMALPFALVPLVLARRRRASGALR